MYSWNRREKGKGKRFGQHEGMDAVLKCWHAMMTVAATLPIYIADGGGIAWKEERWWVHKVKSPMPARTVPQLSYAGAQPSSIALRNS